MAWTCSKNELQNSPPPPKKKVQPMKEKRKCSNIRLKTRWKQQITDVTQNEEYGRKLKKDAGKTAGEAWLKNNPYEVKMSNKDNKGKRYLTLTRIGSNISSASCSLEHFSYAYKNAPESSIKPSHHYITLAIIYKKATYFLS